MKEKSPVLRKSFIRVASLLHVANLVKEAKRVGYEVKKNGSGPLSGLWSVAILDHSPEAVSPGALVFKAVQMREGVWAVTYSGDYWAEPAPVLPATPENWAKHLQTNP